MRSLLFCRVNSSTGSVSHRVCENHRWRYSCRAFFCNEVLPFRKVIQHNRPPVSSFYLHIHAFDHTRLRYRFPSSSCSSGALRYFLGCRFRLFPPFHCVVPLLVSCEKRSFHALLSTTATIGTKSNGGIQKSFFREETNEESRPAFSFIDINTTEEWEEIKNAVSHSSATNMNSEAAINEKGGNVMDSSDTAKSENKEKFSSTCTSCEMNAATYPLHFRMILLRRALEQYRLLQTLQVQRSQLLEGCSSLHPIPPPSSSSLSSVSDFVPRKVLEDLCALCHITNSSVAIEKLIDAALVVPLDETKEEFHLHPAAYVQEQDLRAALKEELKEKHWCQTKEKRKYTTCDSSFSLGDTEHADTTSAACPTANCASSYSSTSSPPEDMRKEEKKSHSSNETKGSALIERSLEDVAPPVLESMVTARIKALESEEAKLRQRLQMALRRGNRFGHRIFLFIAFAIACQIAIVARLTFFELDWDTMEPITYCFGVFVSLMCYIFFMWYGKEGSYEDIFKGAVPSYVRRRGPKDFDWSHYEKVCQQLKNEREMRERIRKWASEN